MIHFLQVYITFFYPFQDKTLTDEEIEKWINSGNAMDKAGAYAVQEEFGKFIEKIEGNYATIVGLPIHKVYQVMKQYL